MNTKETLTETAKAFRDRLRSYDVNSIRLYTFEAKGCLERLQASLTRLYDNGCISPSDFKRFDAMLFERIARLY